MTLLIEHLWNSRRDITPSTHVVTQIPTAFAWFKNLFLVLMLCTYNWGCERITGWVTKLQLPFLKIGHRVQYWHSFFAWWLCLHISNACGLQRTLRTGHQHQKLVIHIENWIPASKVWNSNRELNTGIRSWQFVYFLHVLRREKKIEGQLTRREKMFD